MKFNKRQMIPGFYKILQRIAVGIRPDLIEDWKQAAWDQHWREKQFEWSKDTTTLPFRGV